MGGNVDKQRIDEIKESAKEVEGTGNPVEPGTKVKGKPGRKPGQKNKPKSEPLGASEEAKSSSEEINVPTKEILKPGLMLISKSCQQWARHEKAAMTDGELETIAQLMGNLFDKYAPQAFSKYGLEITCAVVISQYGLRVVQLKRAVDEHERNQHFKEKPPEPVSTENLKPEVRPWEPTVVN